MTTSTDFGEVYIINSRSYIKNISHYLDEEFLKALKNDNGTLKDHVSNLDTNAIYYDKKCIKATLPTCYIEIEYKTNDKDTHYIDYSCFLYEEDYPNLEALEAYKDLNSYGFGSQVSQETIDIINLAHNGYGYTCISSEGY